VVGRTTTYLNTDLDLVSVDDLTLLAEAFAGAGVTPLHVTWAENGLWYARFETDQQHQEPESNIAAMLCVLDTFPSPLRAVWDKCQQRAFNVGYDTGLEPFSYSHTLSAAILERMAAAGASFGLTIYSYQFDDFSDHADSGAR
jgi:hypothetical protein